jgi:dienelactone hydrolase
MISLRSAAGTLLALFALFGTAGAAGADDASALPPASVHERVLSVPGDPDRPVTLQVTLFTPEGPGPFPLAVMNHGANGTAHPEDEPRYRNTFSAYYFLSRGYAVALPMMRGFAGSGGHFDRHGCDVVAAGIGNARDIAAVINWFAKQPNIDASRVVVAGQSFGGWNTLASGLVSPPGVRGLVNFAGGMRESDCRTQDASLIAATAYFGANTRLPSIWFYGDNDKVFPPDTWRQMHARYTSAGGKAELVAFGSFMDDAHQLLSHSESMPVWTPKLDAFLTRIGLPGSAVYPQYLPTPLPPATHFAALDDAAAVPYLSDAGRNSYRGFLKQPFTRAFVVAPNGTAVTTHGGFDALARALGMCGEHAEGCQLYAADDRVVWTGTKTATAAAAGTAAPAAAASTYRKTVAAGATTTLAFAYGVNPDCSSRGVPKLWVVQPPQHGTANVAPRTDFARFPSNNPLSACNTRKVPGIAVDYTPADGFAGSDTVVFEEISLEHHDRVFQFAITVR